MQISTLSRNLIKLLSFGSQTNCSREILVDVMQRFVQSYFLISNNTAPKENWDSLAEMFNGTIYPRNYIDGNTMEYAHLFRSSARPPSYLVDQNIPSTKNPFVTS